MSRARTLLVKLRHQVSEVTQGALQQGTHRLLLCIEDLEEGGGALGGGAPPVHVTSPVADANLSQRNTSSSGMSAFPSMTAVRGGGGAQGEGVRTVKGKGEAAQHPIGTSMEELGQLVGWVHHHLHTLWSIMNTHEHALVYNEHA